MKWQKRIDSMPIAQRLASASGMMYGCLFYFFTRLNYWDKFKFNPFTVYLYDDSPLSFLSCHWKKHVVCYICFDHFEPTIKVLFHIKSRIHTYRALWSLFSVRFFGCRHSSILNVVDGGKWTKTFEKEIFDSIE